MCCHLVIESSIAAHHPNMQFSTSPGPGTVCIGATPRLHRVWPLSLAVYRSQRADVNARHLQGRGKWRSLYRSLEGACVRTVRRTSDPVSRASCRDVLQKTGEDGSLQKRAVDEKSHHGVWTRGRIERDRLQRQRPLSGSVRAKRPLSHDLSFSMSKKPRNPTEAIIGTSKQSSHGSPTWSEASSTQRHLVVASALPAHMWLHSPSSQSKTYPGS
ncbi:uncharacterized protein [Phyllobates terribilis]|uniref:uncharacterized protein n=1 Tax=Phyllobates terribilis TaxID=111132 RepID=UPI003CCAA4E0